jgi:hypothetical protein
MSFTGVTPCLPALVTVCSTVFAAFVWSEKTEIAAARFVGWIGISRGKFFDWRKRSGKANEHNAQVPRDHWLTDEERRAIIAYHERFPLEGGRRLTFMMIDQDVVAVSPCSAPPASIACWPVRGC